MFLTTADCSEIACYRRISTKVAEIRRLVFLVNLDKALDEKFERPMKWDALTPRRYHPNGL